MAIRLLLIALLPLLALLIYLDGQHYDPDLVEFQSKEGGFAQGVKLFPETIVGLERMGQIRLYDEDSLYEYINGHAEYFIGAGFRGLAVGEFAAPGDTNPQLIVNLYDMATPLNAYGVLVDEAGDQESLDVGTMGFGSDQGVNFIHGPYYVQMSLFGAAIPPAKAARVVSDGLKQVVSEGDLAFRFPDLGTVISTRFVREYYRGLEFMHKVLERTFEKDGMRIQAFMVSGTPQDIERLVAAYNDFLREEGVAYEPERKNGLTFYKVEDPYEGNWFYLPLETQLIGVYSVLDSPLAAAMRKFADSSVKTEITPVRDQSR